MASVEIIPILEDNYVFLLKSENSNDVVMVDPGESEKCIEVLNTQGLNLVALLITHHHNDHIDGIPGLKTAFPNLKVYAPKKNRNDISNVDHFVENGMTLQIADFDFQALELPGHTLGIVGYFERNKNWLFSGDVLFGLGVGRLFEGTPEMLFESLKKIKCLPAETRVYCTHEYTQTNARFTDKLFLEHKVPMNFNKENFERYKKDLLIKRGADKPSIPLVLRAELMCNVFLLAESAAEVGELRQLRNGFR